MDRLHFLLYRPLQFIPLLIGITLVSFLLVHLAPGDLAHLFAGGQMNDLAEVRARYGLDHPVVIQYFYFVGNLLQGQLGQSIAYQAPVFSVVADHLWPTLFLIIYGAMLAMTITIPLSLAAARHQGGLIDRIVRALSVGGLGAPAFWLGTMLIFLLSIKLGLFPESGYGDTILIRLQHLFLPALTLALALAPLLIRSLRRSLLHEMAADHVTAARSRGLPERMIFRHHVFQNALIPAVRLLGLNIGWLVGSTVVVEQVFAIPGLGGLIVAAILGHDYLVVQAIAIVMGIFIIAVKYLFDIATAAIDPRVRL